MEKRVRFVGRRWRIYKAEVMLRRASWKTKQRSNWPHSNGSPGSTISACSNRSAAYRRPKPRPLLSSANRVAGNGMTHTNEPGDSRGGSRRRATRAWPKTRRNCSACSLWPIGSPRNRYWPSIPEVRPEFAEMQKHDSARPLNDAYYIHKIANRNVGFFSGLDGQTSAWLAAAARLRSQLMLAKRSTANTINIVATASIEGSIESRMPLHI